jgi:hypothetical protein
MTMANLQFNLSDPDDRKSHDMAVNADNLFFVLWDLDQWLRMQNKHSEHDHYGEVIRQLYEFLELHDISLERFA